MSRGRDVEIRLSGIAMLLTAPLTVRVFRNFHLLPDILVDTLPKLIKLSSHMPVTSAAERFKGSPANTWQTLARNVKTGRAYTVVGLNGCTCEHRVWGARWPPGRGGGKMEVSWKDWPELVVVLVR